jgi:ADP-ribosyl-[dinitrogen reductase] hydrolase
LRRDRALGAVVGSAVGDALGAGFEFGPPGAYSRRFPTPVLDGNAEQQGGGSFGWAPGEFTDDTQMAVVQGLALLAYGGFDGAHLFARFQAWVATATDVGNQTRAALTSGLPWNQAAASYYRRNPHRSAGNGGVMRASPSAVFGASLEPEATIQLGRELAAVTHGDPAAQWGAALHHRMIQVAILGGDPIEELPAAFGFLPADQHRLAEMLEPQWTPAVTNLPNGTVWTCLAQAVWAVRSTETFESALVAAIDLGGDTDTVAAVAGGLAGARYGIDAIPARWTRPLHGHLPGYPEPWRVAELDNLTDRLLVAGRGAN